MERVGRPVGSSDRDLLVRALNVLLKNPRINACLVAALLLTPSCVQSVSRRDSVLGERSFGKAVAEDTLQILRH